MRRSSMNDTIWKAKTRIIQSARKNEGNDEIDYLYYHYTSLEVLFNILDDDSFWASNVRFSNDEMEERVIKLHNQTLRDDYIICFSSGDDMLSQWRGYCHNGGAAIEMEMRNPKEFSVLHADYDMSKKYRIYENTPLPVVYLKDLKNSYTKRKEIENLIDADGFEDISLEDMLPYLKNGKFSEEKELRMVFSNINGDLSKCIRFRTLTNGVKVPFIVVKSGNMGKMLGNCTMNINKYTDEYLDKCAREDKVIWVDEGTNQEKKYYELMKKIDECKNRNSELRKIKVYCKGHLPIKQIIVAPTYDKNRIAEQVKRFCMSKYWLQNVEVKISEIPYIKQY